jgi:hypothetical protein
MNLGQMMLVVGALAMLGLLTLSTNRTIMESNKTQNDSEFGVTAVSIATSVVEEAMGTMFDAAIGDTNVGAVTSVANLTAPLSLGHSVLESYRAHIAGTRDFGDFDDFKGLFLVYKSPSDTASTAGSDYEFVVPGIRNKYFARVQVNYVDLTNLGSTLATNPRSWYKRMTVTVTTPVPRIGSAAQQLQDSLANTLVFPAIMAYWN